jgi:hypothetical protein
MCLAHGGVTENLSLAIDNVFNKPDGTEEWLLVGALAVLTFVGQVAIVCAMKVEQAGLWPHPNFLRGLRILGGKLSFCISVLSPQLLRSCV